MARLIALMSLVALGLSGAPVHEPVHAGGRQRSMTVTKRSDWGSVIVMFQLGDRKVFSTAELGRIESSGAAALRRRPGASARPLALAAPAVRAPGQHAQTPPINQSPAHRKLGYDSSVAKTRTRAPFQADYRPRPLRRVARPVLTLQLRCPSAKRRTAHHRR